MKTNKIVLFLVLAMSFTQAHAVGGISAGGDPGAPSGMCRFWGGQFDMGRSPRDISPSCSFDGATIEYWTLFSAAQEGKYQQAVSAFLNHGPTEQVEALAISDQAPAYCRLSGGRVVVYTDSAQTPMQMCEFSDHSAIEVNALLSGPQIYSKLAKVLQQVRPPMKWR